ncbi:hypothetical protein TVNIR_3398 [Thioalkalivibrio nitratireducens DSM 14787]|uniref:Uncharacterized protein n=1 Tax=Thioalkalivibrio nitratireducens (strain DSM 14787 / UNIQEM 213 / ALEN2) TaxID=1255043 RepID=L0DZL0_THIND|nr:hypothetical protein TVNIR_3398 [Thioalkalivibrio nitratireducens DSM 14787]
MVASAGGACKRGSGKCAGLCYVARCLPRRLRSWSVVVSRQGTGTTDGDSLWHAARHVVSVCPASLARGPHLLAIGSGRRPLPSVPGAATPCVSRVDGRVGWATWGRSLADAGHAAVGR